MKSMTLDRHQQGVEAFNVQDAEAVADVYTDDAVLHDPQVPEPIRGREAIRESYEQMLQSFPDAEVTMLNVDAENDLIMYEFEKEECAIAFLKGIFTYYASLGVAVARVMADNGSGEKQATGVTNSVTIAAKHRRTGTGAENQRDGTENGGHHRHHHRAQPNAAGVSDGIGHRPPRCSATRLNFWQSRYALS